MGSYSEEELTRFSNHALRPIWEPKKGKELNIVQKSSQIQAGSTTNNSASGTKNRLVGRDDTVLSEKVRPSTVKYLKRLPHGIGYAETINAGKSRLE